MAVAARKPLFEFAHPPGPRSRPRLANAVDQAQPSTVHAQHGALEAAFTGRSEHPRLRAVTFSLLILASLGLWAAIITAAIYVGRMVSP